MRRLCAALLAVLILGAPSVAQAVEMPDPQVSATAPPAVVALFADDFSTEPGSQFCSGVLVGKNWVLTAAHCVADLSRDTKLSVGLYVKDRRELVRVKAFYYPEWFRTSSFGDADVALLHLVRNVKGAQPIAISTSSHDTAQFVFGYGLSSAAGLVDRPLGARTKTRTRLAESYFGIDPVRLIGASVVGRFPEFTEFGPVLIQERLIAGVCNGDSGGPLIGQRASDGRRVVVGVVSFGEESCWAESPGIYTRLSAYQHWIANTIESH
jgi:secreted trypsin-like serine protease